MQHSSPPFADALLKRLAEIAAAVRFYSRLPMPRLGPSDDPAAPPSLPQLAWAVPIAGALIALPGALVLATALAAGLAALPASALAVAVQLAVTGALHEDGLADTFDGFGGGWGRERKLEIMRDSRIGAFGAAAIVMALMLRVTMFAAIAGGLGPGAAFAAFIAGQSASRVGGVALLAMVPPARRDGAAAAVGRPRAQDLAAAFFAAVLITLVLVAPRFGVLAALAAAALIALVTVAMAFWCDHQIGGQTGDVLGADQQLSEIAFLLVLATVAG